MKELEKQIEDAAQKYAKSRLDASTAWGSFVDGAKSEAAREYWQEGMYSKEDLREAFSVGYNKAVSSINEDRFDEEDNAPTFEQWFNFYKK